MTTLEGQKVVVTGGSRGLGLAMAKEIAGGGYRVIAIARTQSTELTAAYHLQAWACPAQGAFRPVCGAIDRQNTLLPMARALDRRPWKA